MYQVLTGSKDLNGRLLGSRLLNRMGLHARRVQVADLCTLRRKRMAALDNGWRETLERDGFLVLKDFLPSEIFEVFRCEAEAAVSRVNDLSPAKQGRGKHFGAKQNHAWGFDRYDGGTLNRFININALEHPCAGTFRHMPMLRSLTQAAAGGRQRAQHVWFYLTLHGCGDTAGDPQKSLHRDTFFSSAKFWYFLRPVTADQGPFEYIPGSHKLTGERLAWENKMALKALEKKRGQRSSSFRLSEADAQAMGLPSAHKLVVPENTMVIADTFGFHRRGDAEAGTERLAMYGNMRPWPFSPGIW